MPAEPPLRLRRLLRPSYGAPILIGALIGLAVPLASLDAQETRDLRPRAWSYTVVDGLSVPQPLGGASGDPARGREIYDDPARGGCSACHAAPGIPLRSYIPLALAERAPPPPPEPEAPPALDDPDAPAEPDGPPPSQSDSPRAPRAAALPPARPDPDPDPGAAPAEGETPGETLEDPGPALALLPLPPGPDLAGLAARLSEGEARLLLINPRVSRIGSRMPAYHNVSLTQAALTPGLRQPWFTAQELEDVLAYLMTLEAETPPAAEAPAPQGPETEAAPQAPDAEPPAVPADAEPPAAPADAEPPVAPTEDDAAAPERTQATPSPAARAAPADAAGQGADP